MRPAFIPRRAFRAGAGLIAAPAALFFASCDKDGDTVSPDSVNAIYQNTYTTSYYPCIKKADNKTERCDGLVLELTGGALILRDWPQALPPDTNIYGGKIKLEKDSVIISSLYTDEPKDITGSGMAGRWSNVFDANGKKLGIVAKGKILTYTRALFLGKDSLAELRVMLGDDIDQFDCESFNSGWLDKGGNGIIVRAMN